jgi:hypothetical protein
MARVRVYDPPMCCSSGVCGPNPDTDLVRFARDIAWLERHDVDVERYNLAQEPKAFVENSTVLAALNAEDASCLPLILVDGEIVARANYPSRERLLELLGITVDAS